MKLTYILKVLIGFGWLWGTKKPDVSSTTYLTGRKPIERTVVYIEAGIKKYQKVRATDLFDAKFKAYTIHNIPFESVEYVL